MAPFPDTPGFSGTLRPIRLEGDVPEQLSGTFHRVHPDAQFRPHYENDQFFNGDGRVSLFRFRNGKVEREAGKSLFGAYRNPLTDDEAVKGMIRGTATRRRVYPAGLQTRPWNSRRGYFP